MNSAKSLQILAVLSLSLYCFRFDRPPVLLFSMDGFRSSYIYRNITPNIWKLGTDRYMRLRAIHDRDSQILTATYVAYYYLIIIDLFSECLMRDCNPLLSSLCLALAPWQRSRSSSINLLLALQPHVECIHLTCVPSIRRKLSQIITASSQ